MKTFFLSGLIVLVHSWYDPICCSEKDCRSIPASTVQRLDNGDYYITDRKTLIQKEIVKIGQDDQYHLCAGSFTDGVDGLIKDLPHCFYIPQPTT